MAFVEWFNPSNAQNKPGITKQQAFEYNDARILVDKNIFVDLKGCHDM